MSLAYSRGMKRTAKITAALSGWILLGVGLALAPEAAAEPGRVVPQKVSPTRLLRRIQKRILSRKVVRPTSRAMIQKLVNAAGNADRAARGKSLVDRLAALTSAKRQLRDGYGMQDTEYRARGLASSLGLRKGDRIVWDAP